MGCRFIVKLVVLIDWAWIFAAETLTDWLPKAVEALEPIASALQAQAFEAFVLHVDATGMAPHVPGVTISKILGL
jgi:hypothetical protein